MFSRDQRAFLAGLAVGLTPGLLFAAVAAPERTDLPSTSTTSAQAAASPMEDQPGWSCVDDGNRICGPGNSQGAPAGLYDAGGVLVLTWDQLIALGIVRVA